MSAASRPPVELPPEHRRRWLVRTLVAVVVAVGLIVGGPWLYAKVIVPEPREPLALSTPSPSPDATVDPSAEPLDLEGTWLVGDGSLAGYRLGEVLSGEQVTVAGRTDEVSGSVTVTAGMLTQATVVVETAGIATDESARDAYFRRALDTTTYPQATFELTAPVDVSMIATETGTVVVDAPGNLTFHGVSRPVTASLEVQRTAEGVEVVGQLPVVLEEYGLEAPDLGFVTVEPTGSVEFRLLLTR